MLSLCENWEFTPAWSEAFSRFESDAESVRLPHNPVPMPLHNGSPEQYSLLCGYRKRLTLPPEAQGKRVFLQFDGAAHIATLYINGQEVQTHRCGYTAFRHEITQAASGGTVDIALRLDTSENPQIPPFGFVVDYLTYGGLYREVWLDIREKSFLEDVTLSTPTLDTLCVTSLVSNPGPGQELLVQVLDANGQTVGEGSGEDASIFVPGAHSWDVEHPYLYICQVRLMEGDRVLDEQAYPFGFRTIQFQADGFYLNGKKLFLRGLNRHQCYPYIGYAATESLQREDARILKQELGCNAVRTSHYPQSHYFLDECDRLGLLVFTEIPGWQHLGDEEWKAQVVENVREMITQYRNHTSIFLWGVRINESVDCDQLYCRTNALAHQLDPTRPTSGVRYLEKSSLLEDVYAYNDFSHTGKNPGCKPKKDVTPDLGKALLISECNGHMFPTKPYDSWGQRQEHALRHARVQDAAQGDGAHAGCFGWCMFDYGTHRDFGSGDRICYHGVMDSFRNPKLAAALYASQSDDAPVLEVGSSMDIGDYPGGQIDPVYVFTNADELRLYKNDDYVSTLRPKGWKGLPHGPILLDDTIGCLLETKEGFDKKKAALLRRCLISAKVYGLAGLPAADKLRLLRAMAQYKLTFQDGVDLYGKYVGNWGGEVTRWRFDAVRDGKVVASQTRGPAEKLHLEVRVSSTKLTEKQTYDMAAIRVRILDQNGTVSPYTQLPVTFQLSGPVQLEGPATATAEGGMCGSYIRTVGQSGSAKLIVSVPGIEPVSVSFTVEV